MPSTRRWVLTATILGSAMAFIDTTVINVALPVMQRELRAGVNDAQWIIDAYLLVLSSLILAGGSLGDSLGRARVFAFGIAVFAAASLWCGLAPSSAQLIAARTLQGAGAALLVPGSLALLSDAFPKEERGRAIGTWSALTSLAIIAGPVLGGALVQAVSWRAVFFINVPLAAVVLWIVWRHMPAGGLKPAAPRAVDWVGTALVTLALGGLAYGFIERVWAAAIAGAVLLIVFVLVERRVKNPIVPLALFRSPTFTGANVLTLLLYAALSAATFLLPFNLIQVQGYGPAKAGAALLPFVATMSLLSRWTGALADRIGARPLLIVGPLLAGAGLALLAYPSIGGSYWTTFFPGVLVLGLGMAIVVAPLTTTVMTSFDDESRTGAASGINNAVARAAGLLAIAVFGAIAISVFGRDLDARLRDVRPDVRQAVLAQRVKLAETMPPRGIDPATRARIESAVKHSFVRAFRVNVLIAGGLAVLAAAGAFGVRRPQPPL